MDNSIKKRAVHSSHLQTAFCRDWFTLVLFLLFRFLLSRSVANKKRKENTDTDTENTSLFSIDDKEDSDKKSEPSGPAGKQDKARQCLQNYKLIKPSGRTNNLLPGKQQTG